MSKRPANSDDVNGPSKRSSLIQETQQPSPLLIKHATFSPVEVNTKRTRLLSSVSEVKPDGETIILWMSRDQRLYDNHAVIFAQRLAKMRGLKFKIVFNLVPTFLDATLRQFDFMLRGLREVEQQCRSLSIPFTLLSGDPVDNISRYAMDCKAACVVVDFSPIRTPLSWVSAVATRLEIHAIPFVQVDAHNVVPCWIASNKLEYGARTIRPKIERLLPEYLTPFQDVLPGDPSDMHDIPMVDWDAAYASLKINRDVKPVNWLNPGYSAGLEMIDSFINTRLKTYGDLRNDPNVDTASHLSPYAHFGQISMQATVLRIKGHKKHIDSTNSFVEEAIVRRELADNFCFYNQRYDQLSSCYEWAKETLLSHSEDPRPYLYSQEQLECAHTHDDLWNAAQLQMVREGKMHGFLRMYWAKKILEWTSSPEEALRIAIHLNDKYELDGRDPNGYVGCMWSIGGIHDQGWGERAIFGKIRYMNYEGCRRKFDVKTFVAKYSVTSSTSLSTSIASTITKIEQKKK